MTAATYQYLGLFALEIAALHGIFRWVERKWPDRPRVDVSGMDVEVRAAIARRADRVGTTAALLSVVPVLAAWCFGFHTLQKAFVPTIEGARFVRLPAVGWWHIWPGLFASIVLAGPVGLIALRLVYRSRFHEVMAIGEPYFVFQFHVPKVMYTPFVWVVPLCVDAETMVLGRFLIFTDAGIHARGLLERRPTFRPYSEITTLYGRDEMRERRGKLVPDRRFVIEFGDGSEVPSPPFAYHDDRPEDLGPLRLATQKSGVPIRWVSDLP